jgi:rare lipoprotein A
MRDALLFTGCLGLLLVACGEKRNVRAAIPSPVVGSLPEVGVASWYGHPYHGRASASGEIYDMEQMTAAHRTLPFGTWVRVFNLDNDKTVAVRINDRGPFVDNRVIDLSHAAARAIGMIGPGLARVRLEIMATPAAVTSGFYAVQVGAFQVRANAERLRAEMEARYGSARMVLRSGEPPLWRVLVGQESTVDGAGSLAARLRSEQDGKLSQAFVVRQESQDALASNRSL